MSHEVLRKLQEQIPALYSTENIPAESKMIYQRYHFAGPIIRNGAMYDSRGFNWLLAELERKENLAYGWASLNDEQNAEWGYMHLPEVESTGATNDKNWLPLYFPEAKRLCYGYLEDAGTKEHFDWWRHHYQDFLRQEHGRATPKLDYQRYVEHLYRVQFNLVT